MNKLRVLFSGLFLATLLATALISTPTASAYTRRHVCADDLYVRDYYAIWIGTLHRGETFDIYGPGHYSGTVYGYAWGGVNKYGYVYSQWLC